MSQGSTGSVLVMVPTLNEERGIRRVLKDVPKDIDVLVVDGGSADETVEVARQYLEYLTLISAKHKVDSGRFFSSLLDAFQHKEATCGKLSIECRMKTRNHAIFLITNTQKVIEQFPIPMHILAKTNLPKEFTTSLRL